MNILSIDTSSNFLSYNITKDNNLIYQYNRVINRGASLLVGKLEETFKKMSMQVEDLDLFIIGSGPGSFTGLRISFAAIKAFALAVNKPVFCQNSFFACAYPFRKKEKKIVVIGDAKKNLVYAGFFISDQKRLKQKSKIKLMKLKDCLQKAEGYLFVAYDSHLRKKAKKIEKNVRFYEKNVYPRAEYLVNGNNFDKIDYKELKKIKPLYLHSVDCQVTKKNR
ncbi:MAG: tRNA (adenosine(37)-N6)-threonylcarbamoyltransferase complex dimerization subunit type 1 TsaB [Candidatus Omnitrophica bacterium]|nr:tRNA (adenosine(37)-N6)-threonylcarbamoyltransferase complex dimerization subunit type 1 TsaB [Candidatus Omnitrophota bacterium]MCF7894569.1 tRNA (adenosine(37)-N6)-threonylcarbamoyltransferase complex dimerization subunit type 1 TsaB [Candidatus Omnitrophota bacterium]